MIELVNWSDSSAEPMSFLGGPATRASTDDQTAAEFEAFLSAVGAPPMDPSLQEQTDLLQPDTRSRNKPTHASPSLSRSRQDDPPPTTATATVVQAVNLPVPLFPLCGITFHTQLNEPGDNSPSPASSQQVTGTGFSLDSNLDSLESQEAGSNDSQLPGMTTFSPAEDADPFAPEALPLNELSDQISATTVSEGDVQTSQPAPAVEEQRLNTPSPLSPHLELATSPSSSPSPSPRIEAAPPQTSEGATEIGHGGPSPAGPLEAQARSAQEPEHPAAARLVNRSGLEGGPTAFGVALNRPRPAEEDVDAAEPELHAEEPALGQASRFDGNLTSTQADEGTDQESGQEAQPQFDKDSVGRILDSPAPRFESAGVIPAPSPEAPIVPDGLGPDSLPGVWSQLDAGAMTPQAIDPSPPPSALTQFDLTAGDLAGGERLPVSVHIEDTPTGVEVQVSASDSGVRESLLGGLEHLADRIQTQGLGVVYTTGTGPGQDDFPQGRKPVPVFEERPNRGRRNRDEPSFAFVAESASGLAPIGVAR